MSSTLTDADKVIKQSSLMFNADDQKVKSPASEDKIRINDFYHSQRFFEFESQTYHLCSKLCWSDIGDKLDVSDYIR